MMHITMKQPLLIFILSGLSLFSGAGCAQGGFPGYYDYDNDYDNDYDEPLQPVQYDRCDWREARRHIDWVFDDRDARATLREAIAYRNYPPYDAVLYAQNHNRDAQAAIEDCYRRSRRYIEERYASLPRRDIRPGRPSESYNDCDWDDARRHIDWVLSDRGARTTMENAIRRRNMSAFDAVLYAQNHNRDAQRSIQACSRRARNYIDDNYSRIPDYSGNDRDYGRGACDWNEAKRHIDWAFQDEAAKKQLRDEVYYRATEPFRAVMLAQSHNRRAQEAIKACASQSQRYIQKLASIYLQ